MSSIRQGEEETVMVDKKEKIGKVQKVETSKTKSETKSKTKSKVKVGAKENTPPVGDTGGGRFIDKYITARLALTEHMIPGIPKKGGPTADAKFLRSDNNKIVIKHHRLFALMVRAKAENNLDIDIRKIDFDTEIENTTTTTVCKYGARLAEVLVPKGGVKLRFGLPNNISDEVMRDLIEKAGAIGLSPHGDEGYRGLYTVEEMVTECLEETIPAPRKSTRPLTTGDNVPLVLRR